MARVCGKVLLPCTGSSSGCAHTRPCHSPVPRLVLARGFSCILTFGVARVRGKVLLPCTRSSSWRAHTSPCHCPVHTRNQQDVSFFLHRQKRRHSELQYLSQRRESDVSVGTCLSIVHQVSGVPGFRYAAAAPCVRAASVRGPKLLVHEALSC